MDLVTFIANFTWLTSLDKFSTSRDMVLLYVAGHEGGPQLLATPRLDCQTRNDHPGRSPTLHEKSEGGIDHPYPKYLFYPTPRCPNLACSESHYVLHHVVRWMKIHFLFQCLRTLWLLTGYMGTLWSIHMVNHVTHHIIIFLLLVIFL